MSTAVITFVLTPQTMWHLNHSRLCALCPYFASYHRTNRLVENPVASTAKSVSTALRGKLLTVTNSLSIAVSAATPTWAECASPWGCWEPQRPRTRAGSVSEVPRPVKDWGRGKGKVKRPPPNQEASRQRGG